MCFCILLLDEYPNNLGNYLGCLKFLRGHKYPKQNRNTHTGAAYPL